MPGVPAGMMNVPNQANQFPGQMPAVAPQQMPHVSKIGILMYCFFFFNSFYRIPTRKCLFSGFQSFTVSITWWCAGRSHGKTHCSGKGNIASLFTFSGPVECPLSWELPVNKIASLRLIDLHCFSVV